jgi:cysteine desulfurase
MQPIYMDNNATTACDPAVVAAMLPYFTEQFGNASSIHSFGSQVGKAIKQARMQVQSLLGAAHDSEIVFNSCGTESDATAILSALKANPERRTVITTVVEHPAILNLCAYLEKEDYVVHRLRVDRKGRLDLDEYRSLLNERVAIVSAMWANNETGTLFPVEEMAEMAHAKGILFHTDAVQAVGKVAIDLKSTQIDMLSLSGHKLHAPKGIGVLYVRRNTRFRPLLRGGHQERGRRAGTENSASIVGLGVACELAQQHLVAENTTVKRLRDRLERGILGSVRNAFVNGDTLYRLPNTASIAFEYVEGEGHSAAPQPARHCRVFRLGLHLGLAGAVACHARDGHPLHRGTRDDSLLAFALQHRRGSGPRHRRRTAGDREVAETLPVLER